MNQPWPELVTLLNQASPDLDHVQQASHELQTQLLDDHQVPLDSLLEHLGEQQGPSSRQQEIVWEYLLTVLVQHLSQSHVWQAGYLDPVLQLYQLLGTESNIRHQLLHLCTQVGDSACLTAVADQLSADPPLSSTTVGVVFAPLFQDRDLPYDNLFPRLLDTLQHPSVAAATLDLTNYLVRKERFAQHPASDCLDSLQLLMRDLNQRLQHLVEQPTTRQDNLQQLSHTISESVALVIAGCNTLALIGQSSSIAVLRQTMELPHRRLQVEAAAALAKLGEAAGIETLIALAAEPVVRLHALTYANELDLTDQIDSDYLTDVAKAEGELALWLSHEQQMGIPPTDLECIDQRNQFWPGYEVPVDCFLIRYHFQFGETGYSNLGIVGPVTHSLTADLADLPPADVYAIFAGWHAEHEEIQQQDVAQLDELQMVDVSRFQEILEQSGYQKIEPHTWGSFLGDPVLVAVATQDVTPGVVVADSNNIYWHPRSAGPRPLTADDVYNLYKGRKLMQAFNR